VAFGFVRQAGPSKRYLNPLTGVSLSRRQYAKLTERERAAAVAALRQAATDLESGAADTVADALAGARAAQGDALAAARAAQRAAEQAQREAAALRAQGFRPKLSGTRRENADRLQRQYNALLETYVRSQRAKGRKITKSQARRESDFKSAVRMIRTKRRFGETNMQRQARQQAREYGFAILGGADQFRQTYKTLREIAAEMDEGADEMDEAA
jgi:hypothetical protein